MIFNYNFITRTFDIIFSSIGLMLLLPIFMPVVLILKVTGEGEIFYLQERVGYKKKHFKVIKFATMLKNSPNLGTGAITTRNDPRVLPIGKFLRKTKINELPQLINILNGSMSFVGPRPLMEKQFFMYTPDQQAQITEMKPGLTSYASIYFRDEEKVFEGHTNPEWVYENMISPKKALIEGWYRKNRSILQYILIIFLTAYVVIRPKIEITKILPKGLIEELNNAFK